jgi:two-component system cell cycle sensor histidine kinase/response regulator CckA
VTRSKRCNARAFHICRAETVECANPAASSQRGSSWRKSAATSVTKRLLAFARRETAEPRDVDLNKLIAGVERMLQVTLSAGRSLNFDPAPELGSIRADPRQLEQVLMNLTVNARDAMPNGGTLRMATRNLEVRDSEAAHGLAPGSYVTLRVEDEGAGMDATTQKRIFEPFFTTKGEKGTGLGLSTSYGIIRRYGGHVTVESELGEGTVFTLYFPRMESPLS